MNPMEEMFAFDMMSTSARKTGESQVDAHGRQVPLFEFIDVAAIDDFLDSGKWRSDDLAKLREERASALASYLIGDLELAVAKMLSIQRACEYVGYQESTLKRVVQGQDNAKAQAQRRTGSTILSESEKRQVVRQYDAAITTYGTVKALAREFAVSTDTINRILKAKP